MSGGREFPTTECETWEDFERALVEPKPVLPDERPIILYRGQSFHEWPLATTLERRTNNRSFLEFYRGILSIQPGIEALTEKRWAVPSFREIRDLDSDYDALSLKMTFGESPAYEYLAYLRHHGFPSPLLDWTRSPYIAAYFAFRHKSKNEWVSVYELRKHPRQTGSNQEPQVHQLGPNIRTHRRHVLQQSDYTICLRFEGSAWHFAPHQEGLGISGRSATPNYKIRKFNIRATERIKALKLLDLHNVNAFSLFDSEDSLMETLAVRKYDYD